MAHRSEPLRYQVARDFLAAAKDMGDVDVIAAARRYYRSLTEAVPCTEADKALYRAWLNH